MALSDRYMPRDGDVVKYLPDARFERWWCREGTAIGNVGQDGSTLLVDTYWGAHGSDPHVLTTTEIAGAELVFNIADYDELDQYASYSAEKWARYAPADRREITSQHGLQRRYFVRRGAREDLPTQIANARERVDDAESEVRVAQHNLDWRRRELAALEGAMADA
jgi:hypothetical protein